MTVTDDASVSAVQDLLDELSALATDLGPGELEDYVRVSLTRLVAAVVEHGQTADAIDRLSRSLQLLERERERGLRRAQRRGSADLSRMRALVDVRLRRVLAP